MIVTTWLRPNKLFSYFCLEDTRLTPDRTRFIWRLFSSKYSSTIGKNETTVFKCQDESLEDVLTFRNKLFESSNKLNQDNHNILLHVQIEPIKRQTFIGNWDTSKHRSLASRFFVPQGCSITLVCKKVFLEAFQPVGRSTLDGVTKRRFKSGECAVQGRRGVDRHATNRSLWKSFLFQHRLG